MALSLRYLIDELEHKLYALSSIKEINMHTQINKPRTCRCEWQAWRYSYSAPPASPRHAFGFRPRSAVPATTRASRRQRQKPAGAKMHTAPVQVLLLVANNAPARAKCTECGVVESTREIDTRSKGSGLGALGGAVLGGGRSKDVATVAGAVGGAFAGNQIARQVKSTKSYDITVRLDDGSSRTISETNPRHRKDLGRALDQIRFPLRNLAAMHVILRAQLGQRLLAFDRR
jgi:hypothetical protein